MRFLHARKKAQEFRTTPYQRQHHITAAFSIGANVVYILTCNTEVFTKMLILKNVFFVLVGIIMKTSKVLHIMNELQRSHDLNNLFSIHANNCSQNHRQSLNTKK